MGIGSTANMKWVYRVVVLVVTVSAIGVSGFRRISVVSGSEEGLLARLSQARSLLSNEKVALQKGVVGVRRVKVSRRRYQDVAVMGITGREIALAVLDEQGKFHVVRGVKRDNQGFETLTQGYTLTLRRENGINSEFVSINPPGGRVLALKYPVSNERGRFGGGGEVIEAIYTPYSKEIDSPEIVRQGFEVQRGLIDQAYERLKTRKVYSRAFRGRLITEVVPRETLQVLLINEHIDPGEFRSADLAEGLARKVLTVIGANGRQAYAYSISKAGARGLVQMISSTYALLLRRYPEAGLTADFTAGMSDPVNAVMAQVLLCDSDWEAIRPRFEVGAEQVGPYLAAAYNGGVGRVLSLLANEQEEWMENPDLNRRPSQTITRRIAVRGRSRRGRIQKRYVVKRYVVPIFRSETSKYVSQYHWIKSYLDARNVEGKREKVEVKQ
ncbi:MAG TPA: hypothetical protein VKA60_21745 [Blastocatellia bacterium]|nr:hypothetical protein [Blastocatellia bacterium]